MIKQTDATLKAWLQQAIAATGPYNPGALFAGVYSAIVDAGAATTMANVTEGTGALATRVAATTWSAPYKMADGRWVVDGQEAVFIPASSAEAQAVAGWFLADAATAGVLKAWAPLVPPVNLLNENSHITIVPRITIDPQGRFSAEIVWAG